MINLLSYESKKQTKAARINTILIVYLAIATLASAFLAASCYATYTLINNGKNDSTAVKTQTMINSQRNDIETARIILNKQIPYSQILSGVETSLIPGTVLNNITFSKDETQKIVKIQLEILSKNDKDDQNLVSKFTQSGLFLNPQITNTSVNKTRDGYNVIIDMTMNVKVGSN